MVDEPPSTNQTKEETRGKGNNAKSETDSDFREIITDINEASKTDSATRKPKHVDITMGALNPNTQGIIIDSNSRREWDVAALNPNHEEVNTEAKNLEEARELPLLKA